MEAIKTTKVVRLRPLVMYREDLDELIGHFQRACASVTISDDKFRYVSLDEMKSRGGPLIKNLDIRGEKPGLHFLLNQTATVNTGGQTATYVFPELRTEEITDEADNLFLRVKDFLVDRQSSRVRVPFAAFAIVALIALVVFSVRHKDGIHTYLDFLMLIALSVGFGLSVIVAGSPRGYLSLETRRNSPSFWAKHQEEFKTHAIISVISGVIGYFLGRLLK